MSRNATVNGRNGVAALALLSLLGGTLSVIVGQVRALRPVHDAYLRLEALAQAEIEAARGLRALWLNTEALLAQAGHAAAADDIDTALVLARKARHEARLARNQARLEAARYALALDRARLAPAAAARLEALIAAHEGHAAWALARRLGVTAGE